MSIVQARIPTPTVADSRLQPQSISDSLKPYISLSRQQRIEQVIEQRLISVTVVLERPHDPHNGAAVLRSCEAFGLLHVHIISGTEGFGFSPKVTQNAHKWLTVRVHRDTRTCLSLLAQWGFRCVAAAPPPLGRATGGTKLKTSVAAPPSVALEPIALVFGNEHSGLSTEALEGCNRRFHLPMYGFSESLNLSVSVALALHSIVAQRRAQLGQPGDLPQPARDQLRATYYAASVRRATDIVLHKLNERAR